MLAFPNAKINIGLDILRRRPDGYHDIATVMVPVGWKDILEIVPAEAPDGPDTLTVTGRHVDCPPEKNLVMRAAAALRRVKPFPAVNIFLHKIIPDGAGLGGGSSDAAFTLRLLNDIFSLGLTADELVKVAASLGADCPFFIHNAPMLCTGTGTEMAPIALPLSAGLHIAIVKPQVSVPTAAAYANVTPHVPEIPLENRLASEPVEQWTHAALNAFEASVFPVYPSVARIKAQLEEMGALYCAMSGSGSSVFGIFRNDILADDLKRRFPECDIFTGDFPMP